MNRFFSDLSISTATAGFVTVLVGFTSSVAIVFQAAQAFNATPSQLSSWMWALGIGMGLCSLLPSLWLKKPVLMAWSTPGAAVLAVAASNPAASFTMHDAVGAFLICAALITLFGITGWFEKLMNKIPMAIASALLAGVLARFALQAFAAADQALWLITTMLIGYLVAKRVLPRYAVPITLLIGIVFVATQGQIDVSKIRWEIAKPEFVMPHFSVQAALSLALPLFIVTMASQNMPGVAAIRQAQYDMPISKLITLSGVMTLLLAPFGGFALNLSAITAAICMGPEAHEDKAKRYTASSSAGLIYIVLGIFGAAITGLIAAFPKAMVLAIAGLALLGTIAGGLAAALESTNDREPALIAFLVTLSGITIGGIGSAFWGVVAGLLALLVLKPRQVK
jgi:benzoate membrane transport protein